MVNPNTIARAYRELEVAGVVVKDRGMGTFVAQQDERYSQEEKLSLGFKRYVLSIPPVHTAKLCSSLASCVAPLVSTTSFRLIWALTPARDFGSPSTYLAVHLKYDTSNTLSQLAGTVSVVFVVALRNQVCGFFTEYVPTREQAVLYPLGMVLLGVSTGGIVYMLLQWFPEHQNLVISLLVGTFILLKVGYAI